MYNCEVCGRPTHKKHKLGGYILCQKHMRQLQKHGKLLDNNPRSDKDLNEYTIRNDVVYFDLYNQQNEKISEFTVDLMDIEKVKYHRWRLSHNRVVTVRSGNRPQRELSHILLDVPKDNTSIEVEYIDGNPFNNCRDNLQIVSKSNDSGQMPTATPHFDGVTYDGKRNRYCPEIRIGEKRYHLGRYYTQQEAVYARLTAEILSGLSPANDPDTVRKTAFVQELSEERKLEIAQIVQKKLII